MLTGSGVLLLVAGAILAFAVERQRERVDVQLVGWILMAGGGTALIAAMLRAAARESAARREVRRDERRDELVQVTGGEGWSA